MVLRLHCLCDCDCGCWIYWAGSSGVEPRQEESLLDLYTMSHALNDSFSRALVHVFAMLLLLLYVQTLFRPSALDGCGIGPVIASRVQTCLLAGRNDILRKVIGAIGQTCCEVSVSRVYNDCRGVGRAKVPGWPRITMGWILDDSSTDVCVARCLLSLDPRAIGSWVDIFVRGLH
jgi:hypothetical protein